jgi:hypothetical protein
VLSIDAHLFADDHSGNMAALGALVNPSKAQPGGNVIPLHG